MVNTRALRAWGILLCASLILLVAPLSVTASLWRDIYLGPLMTEMESAQARWDARPFTHYRMTMEHEQIRRKCRQRLEIDHERVVRVLEDTCSTPPPTISDLFAITRQNLTPDRCATDACRCARVFRISPAYDDVLGYPTMLLLVPNQNRTEPADAEYWGQAPGMNHLLNCAPTPLLMYETITISHLQPLP